MSNLYYFGLEPLAARYTQQLCEEWFPQAIADVKSPAYKLVPLKAQLVGNQIGVGSVLDATGRGMYAAEQVRHMLRLIREGVVEDGDVIFLQDFWTPGFEAVVYALHLHRIEVEIYSMLHAQSVDEYDFTWDMRSWMRPMEVGMSRYHTAVFVASTIHKEQLRAAGFECPIHVVGLPISIASVAGQMPAGLVKSGQQRRKNVMFTSRLDREKNPMFMLDVAERFLEEHKDWTWTVSTSAETFRTNEPMVLVRLAALSKQPRLLQMKGLSKEQYYTELAESKIQFNCALQDYVSWTLLEACIAGCDLVYPHFRSFPEILPASAMYQAFDHKSALALLAEKADHSLDTMPFLSIAGKCDRGRILQAQILCGMRDSAKEVNIWHSQV